MRKIYMLFLFLGLFSCDKKETKEEANHSKVKIGQKDTLEGTPKITENKNLRADWQDELIADYIKNSKNDLIKSALKNKENIQWLFDQIEKNDSTQFYIYNIGIDVAEEDGSELRFSSCGWVYLDSVKRKLYEYDLPNEELIAWKK